MSRRALVSVSTALVTLLILAGSAPAQKPTKPAPTTGPKYSLAWMADDVDWSRPSGINKLGDVVGQACFDFVGSGADEVWILDPADLTKQLNPAPPLWEAFVCQTSAGGTASVTNLNVIAGAAVPDYWRLLDAQGINDRGQIVGRAEYRFLEVDSDGNPIAILQDWGVFLYAPADLDAGVTVTIWSLGTRGVAYNEPTSISQGNEDISPVMLMSQEFDNGGHPCIFPVHGNPDNDVVLLPNPTDGPGCWRANAINTLGQVAGNANIGGNVNPVRYTPGAPAPLSLGFLKNPGKNPWGWALDINESGSVTGCSTTSGGSAVHAFRYTTTGMKDLGGLGTSSTIGYGINKNGDVVGEATTSRQAFLVHRQIRNG